MKTIEVRVPCSLSRDQVRQRLDHALVKARDEYKDKVGDIDAAWEGDQLQVGLTVMGMDFDATVDIADHELLVTVGLPGMASLFAGKIKSGIQERLGGLLAAVPG